VEAFYFAFGGEDIYAIVDLPDNVSSSAISLALALAVAFEPVPLSSSLLKKSTRLLKRWRQ